MRYLYLSCLALLFSIGARAQCSTGIIAGTPRYVLDTTYVTYYADMTYFSSAATVSWYFPDDGSIVVGDSVTRAFTKDSSAVYGAGSYSYAVVLNIVDTGVAACYAYDTTSVPYPDVYKCNHTNVASDVNSNEEDCLPGTVSFALDFPFGADGGYYSPPAGWNIQMTLYWGTYTNDSFVSAPTDGYPGSFGLTMAIGAGGPAGFASPSPYIYGGVYNVGFAPTYILSYSGQSCPILPTRYFPVQVSGAAAAPMVSGNVVLCAGDTLRIVASDTTLQFHNLYHNDTPGVLYTCCSGAMSAVSFNWSTGSGSAYTSGDSVLYIPAVTVADSGMYIFYGAGGGCFDSTLALAYDTIHVIVNPIAAAITGTNHVCVGDTIMLFDTPAGGTWSMYSTALASVDPVTGIVTGIAAGFDTVYYTIPGTCTGATARYAITVDAPAVFFATSPSACVGTTDSMHAFTPGGTWSSTDPSVATISTTGILDITSAGSTLVMYTLPTGCNMATLINTYGTPTVTATLLRPLLCTGADTITAAGATSYLWTGGIPCPTCAIATILTPGTYTVTGTDSHGCVGTATATVAAGVIPTVSATNNGPLCAGTTLDLTGTVTGATSYSWSGPGGFTSSVLEPVLTAAPGSYTLIATGSCGTAGDATTVVVTPLPTLTATATYPALCTTAGDTLSASGAATYIWSPSAGLSCAGCASPIVTAPATYTVAGTDLSGCVGYATITIAPGTVPTVTANNNGPLCPGEILDLTSIITGGALTTTWSGPDGFISSAADTAIVGVTTAAVGTYTLTVSNSCGTTVATTDFAISTPTISVTSTPATCGSTFTLAASGASTYTWLPATGLSCTTCSSPVTSTAGTYTVTGTTAGGCIGSNTITIGGNRISGYISFSGATPDTLDMQVWLIQFNPTDSSLTALDSTVTCLSGTTPYYEFDGKPAGNYMTKAKLIYGNTPGSSGYIPTYGASTAYWDTATTIAHGTGFDNSNIDMLYGTVPSGSGFIGGLVSAGADKGTSTTGIPVPDIMIYLRNVANGKIITYTTTDITGAYSFGNLGAGTYKVYPEDYQYRTTQSAPIIISATSDTATGVNFTQHTISMTITPAATAGIKPIIAGSAISVYPNPSSGTVNIAWQNQQTSTASIVVTDVVGREVYNHPLQLTTTSGTAQTDLSNLNDGIYIITIKSGTSNYTGKLTIQH